VSPARRPGRPADPTLDPALRQAVKDELAEYGWRGATLERIAKRAGVAHTTIYRRHGSVHGVMLLLMEDIYAQMPVPDTGSLRTDLVTLIREIAAVWRDPAHVRYLTALVAAKHENADLAEADHQQFERRRAATSAIVTRAIERGDLAPETDGDLLLDLLAGIIAQRVLLRRLALRDDFPEMIVDQVLAGFRPSADAPTALSVARIDDMKLRCAPPEAAPLRSRFRPTT